jgi:hypothetical protein
MQNGAEGTQDGLYVPGGLISLHSMQQTALVSPNQKKVKLFTNIFRRISLLDLCFLSTLLEKETTTTFQPVSTERTPKMKMLPIEQVRINLANLLIEQVREQYPDADAASYTDLAGMFLSALAIYKDELVKLRDNLPGDHERLAELKIGIRKAVDCLEALYADYADYMQGWHYGATPKNMVQHYANVLNRVILELTESVIAIEALYPEDKWLFDSERAGYFRVRQQWAEQDRLEALSKTKQ